MRERFWKLLQCCAVPMAVAGMYGPAASAAPPSSEYQLLFEEEFDGERLNETHWTHRLGERSGANIFRSLNRRENVAVSGGQLRITCRQEMIDGKLANTGGGVISRHQFGYGYYETLSRPFMGGHGVHAAFWQAGGAGGPGAPPNSIFEIDGYEIDSKSSMACHNLYIHVSPKEYKEVPWVHRAHAHFKLNADGSYLSGYEYTPEGVVFYSQGKVIAKAEWPELTAAQVVLLTALNGVGKVDGQPGETTFDYFRYYAKDWPGINLLPNGNFEYNQEKVNPLRPVAWYQAGTDGKSGVIMEGEAARDRYKLRQGLADKPFEVRTWQNLEFIRNGDYELSARVRSSGGQETACIRVSGYGGLDLTVPIPAATDWHLITIPRIPISSHGVTIAIESRGAAGQWLEIDDVQFRKPPLPGQKLAPQRPFVLIGDPIWHLARREPIHFAGDVKFYFFDRNVGFGEAITVVFTMNADRRANTSPVARVPKTGDAGWSVQLTEGGQIIFRIGSVARHQAVVAEAGYAAGKEMHVACSFDRGTARIYINGVLKKTESHIDFKVNDSTAAGRLGCVSNLYEAIGDVIVKSDGEEAAIAKQIPRYRNYAGTLQNVRVYNRAITADEVAEIVRLERSGRTEADR